MCLDFDRNAHTHTIAHTQTGDTIIKGSLEVKLPTLWTDGKAEMGRVREEKKKEDQKRESLRRKKMQVREKVEKLRFTVFFQWFVAPEGRKVGLLKRRVRSHVVRWEMKGSKSKCNYKTCQRRTTFGISCDAEKVHAVVVRSTFGSQNVQSTSVSEHAWKLRCRKSARRCGAKHISKSKCTKHLSVGARLEVEISKKCTPLWCEAHFEVKMYKAPQCRSTLGSWDVEKVHAVVARSTFRSQNVQSTPCSDHFWTSDVVARGRRKGLCIWSKVSKAWGFCSSSENYGRRVTFEEDLQRCISRGRRSIRDMFIRDVKRSGRWFPERGCILEHHIFNFGKMILHDRCSTSYHLASIFRGRRNTLEAWTGNIAKRIGTRPSALHSTFHFWRTSCRIASFLMLSSSEIVEVSQKCFVLDVAKFKNWGSLAELLRFQACR